LKEHETSLSGDVVEHIPIMKFEKFLELSLTLLAYLLSGIGSLNLSVQTQTAVEKNQPLDPTPATREVTTTRVTSQRKSTDAALVEEL
jgi:hypothetical protein